MEEFFSQMGISFFYVRLILGFVFSFLICIFSAPIVISISRKKNLMDEPKDRSSHLRKIPTLGGISIFFAVSVCASIFAFELFELYKFLFASLVILFFVGVTDDIMDMRAYNKLITQIIVSVLIVVGSDVRIRNFFGLFGLYELNYYFSVFCSVLTFVILINAFNLIDGIDGLAGSYSILSSFFFAISYYRLGWYHYPLVFFSSVIIGATLAFLHYNLSKRRRRRIFMGDTGSMILGFLLTFLAICFMDIFIDKRIPNVPRYHLNSAPVVTVSILILPIIDTLNVIIIRLYRRKSVLISDKNHIHHNVVALGLSHRTSTLYIMVYYCFIVMTTYFLRHLENNLLLFIVVVLGFIGAYLPIVLKKIKKS